MQADAEHQQHHADIGQLQGQIGVGDKTGGERPDHDTGQKIANQRRQLQPMRQRAQHKSQAEADNDHADQGRMEFHARIMGQENSGG